VPKLKTLTLAKAKAALKRARCATGKVTKKASRKKKGTVIAQSRRAGGKLPAGSKVDLTVSRGPAKKKVRP
jgi:beta-lactam-binding protein with PASTA domain